jgi:hypothetical protein
MQAAKPITIKQEKIINVNNIEARRSVLFVLVLKVGENEN